MVRPDVAKQQVPAISVIRSKFRARAKAHKTVIGNERWFRFTVKKTVNRHAAVIKILSRAAKRAATAGDDVIESASERLAAKLVELFSNYTSGVERSYTRAEELISSEEQWA